MDAHTRALVGSPHRDAFKHWHKGLDRVFYGCDFDFVLVGKNPPRIIAVLDFKRPSEPVTFAEVLAYNNLLELGIPVYLVSTTPLLPPYASITVRQYLGGDWRPAPPVCQVHSVLERVPPSRFEAWQRAIRRRG